MKTKLYSLIILSSILSNAQEQADSIKKESQENLDEIVITGTMKAVRKADSPVPIEIYTPKFLLWYCWH